MSKDGPDVPLPFSSADKVKHALAFAVVGYSYLRSVKFLLPHWEVWSRRRLGASLALGLGALLELLQALVPYRTAEFADLVADAVGIGFALLAVHLVDRDLQVTES
jgi:VanZ family protein